LTFIRKARADVPAWLGYNRRIMSPQRSVVLVWRNMLTDGVLAAVAAPLARWVAVPSQGLLHPFWFLAGGAISMLVAGLPFRLPQQRWRFVGFTDLIDLVASATAAVLLFWLVRWASGFPLPTPTFPIVHLLVLLSLLAGPRLAARFRHRLTLLEAQTGTTALPILLIGAGEPADLFLRAMGQDREGRYRVVGLLATKPGEEGRRLQGHAVLGPLAALGDVVQRLRAKAHQPSALVLCDPEICGPVLVDLLKIADALGLQVRRAPRLAMLDDVREPINLQSISVEELLNRVPVQLNRAQMAALIGGKRVLITGAGGTIGGELVRQVTALGPARVVLLDQGEFALWQIDTEMAETRPQIDRRAVLADVRDFRRIMEIFEEERPELVFHAAALKHVPMVETNRLEGLRTNVIGTCNVADATRAVNASEMVLISTDKAVNPTNVMGASKRLAEIYCQSLDLVSAREGRGPRFSTVRFGNVLGSTGSVVPAFRAQIARGGPVTVTHPEMDRYFMTVSEAVSLVLQASGMGFAPNASLLGRGTVFVLDMGKPVRILDLARQMILLAGLQPDVDIAINFTGIRPGEKLHEELFHDGEHLTPTSQPGVMVGSPRTMAFAEAKSAIEALDEVSRDGDEAAAVALLARLVPEFSLSYPVPAEPAPALSVSAASAP